MTRKKFDPYDAPEPPRKPLPRRRVPKQCAGSSLGHYWLIGAYLAATARKSVRHPHLCGFFDRHQKREGMIWYACKDCGWADCVTEDRLPMPGRAGYCLDCPAPLSFRPNRNGLQVRCDTCAARHRAGRMAEYRRAWKRRNPEMVAATLRSYKERRKARGGSMSEREEQAVMFGEVGA